jgi:hypothetical protein
VQIEELLQPPTTKLLSRRDRWDLSFSGSMLRGIQGFPHSRNVWSSTAQTLCSFACIHHLYLKPKGVHEESRRTPSWSSCDGNPIWSLIANLLIPLYHE